MRRIPSRGCLLVHKCVMVEVVMRLPVLWCSKVDLETLHASPSLGAASPSVEGALEKPAAVGPGL